MPTTLQIFTGSTIPSLETQSNIFTGGTAIYLLYTGVSGNEYQIDSYLQIFVAPGLQRNIMWTLEANSLTTVNILPIPTEYLGFPMQLVLFASEAIPIELWTLIADCSCKPQLDSIENKVNLLIAGEVISTITNIIGVVISGGASQILPALLPGAVRSAVKIFNPTSEAILIGLGRVPTPASFDEIIPAGSFFDDLTGFGGAFNAITQSGNSITVDITTLP